jgi:hypothetical protein
MSIIFLILLLFSTVYSQTGSMQITPNTPTLYARTTYLVNYYTVFALPANASFTLDFTSTYIALPAGALNVTATIRNIPAASPNGSCTGSRCTLYLNTNAPSSCNIQFTIGSLTNPPFLMQQNIPTRVTFNATYS